MSEHKRISFLIPVDIYERSKQMPFAMRSVMLRVLLERALDAADKHGPIVFGAIMSGEFEISYKKGLER
jgi:hypothetical protein|tara:strand:+ start:142 stop:348 length:207 start_codon:yes stop_codon:yes gene_type:complete